MTMSPAVDLKLLAFLSGVVGQVASTPIAPPYNANSQPIVDLGYSQYQGTSLSSGVNQYLGMRFAAPPLDGLRFRAPIAPINTTGIKNATSVT